MGHLKFELNDLEIHRLNYVLKSHFQYVYSLLSHSLDERGHDATVMTVFGVK